MNMQDLEYAGRAQALGRIGPAHLVWPAWLGCWAISSAAPPDPWDSVTCGRNKTFYQHLGEMETPLSIQSLSL